MLGGGSSVAHAFVRITTLEASAVVCFIVIDRIELTCASEVVSTALYGSVDVDLAALVGHVVVAVSALKSAIDVDPSLLDRRVRILSLS